MIAIPDGPKAKLRKSKQQFCSRISNKLMDLDLTNLIKWKKANVVSGHKNEKQLKENYRTILLLPIC